MLADIKSITPSCINEIMTYRKKSFSSFFIPAEAIIVGYASKSNTFSFNYLILSS